MTNAIEKEFHEILGMLKEHINYQEMCGVDHFPLGEACNLSKDAAHSIHKENILPKDNNITQINNKEADISSLKRDMGECTRCKLSKNRTKIVLGEGSLNAELVFVGEAPGRDEDKTGRPFVGRAGQLLTKIISAMGMERGDVYIMNIVKCRPPENRNPQDDEISTCEPFMLRQLEIIKPGIICTLGTFSTQALLRTKEPISGLRGKFFDYHGIKLMPTYHPAFLLRNSNKKKEVWEDMQQIMNELKKKT
jgi:DNA polymerase